MGIEVSPEAQDLIKRLLEKDKRKRLGAQGDVADILEHPFFKGLDIEKLKNKQLKPPYQPVIKNDLKFFDQNLTNQKNIEESVIDKDRKKFIIQN